MRGSGVEKTDIDLSGARRKRRERDASVLVCYAAAGRFKGEQPQRPCTERPHARSFAHPRRQSRRTGIGRGGYLCRPQRAERRCNSERRTSSNDDARLQVAVAGQRNQARDPEWPIAALSDRPRPHAIPPLGQPIEGCASLGVGPYGGKREWRKRKCVFEKDLVSGYGSAGSVDNVDVKNRAGLHGDRSMVQECLLTCHGQIWKTSVCKRWRVQRHHGDATR
jgi:hypothetical protein